MQVSRLLNSTSSTLTILLILSKYESKLSNILETQPIYRMEYQICIILTFEVKEKETHQEKNIKHFA